MDRLRATGRVRSSGAKRGDYTRSTARALQCASAMWMLSPVCQCSVFGTDRAGCGAAAGTAEA